FSERASFSLRHIRPPPAHPLFPYPTLFRSRTELEVLLAEPSGHVSVYLGVAQGPRVQLATDLIARTATGAEMTAAQRMYGLVHSDRKSTRLNSSHVSISYAVFCLKKKRRTN